MTYYELSKRFYYPFQLKPDGKGWYFLFIEKTVIPDIKPISYNLSEDEDFMKDAFNEQTKEV